MHTTFDFLTPATTIVTNAEINTCYIETVDGIKLTLSPEVEPRMVEAIDGKIFTKTLKGARELAGELNAWGVSEARALGYAVVFWS